MQMSNQVDELLANYKSIYQCVKNIYEQIYFIIFAIFENDSREEIYVRERR